MVWERPPSTDKPMEVEPLEEAVPAGETPVKAVPVEEVPGEASPMEEVPGEASPLEEGLAEAMPIREGRRSESRAESAQDR